MSKWVTELGGHISQGYARVCEVDPPQASSDDIELQADDEVPGLVCCKLCSILLCHLPAAALPPWQHG